MKRLIALVGAAFLAGCAAGTSLFFLDTKTPSQFSPEERAYFDGLPTFGLNGYCAVAVPKVARFTPSDRAIVSTGLQKRGMTKRDVELLLLGQYGTRMTFSGLSCLVGGQPPVNTAFYPGVGHRWQAVMPNGDFVYLEGDGTPKGMHVTAWN